MKCLSHIILSLALLFSTTLSAQLAQGDITIGGNAGLGLDFTSDNSILSFSMAPSYGSFVSDNLLIGSGVTLSLAFTNDVTATVVGVSPFVRHYFNPDAANSHWFLGLETSVLYASGDGDSFLIAGGLMQAGVTYFLVPNVAIDAGPFFSYFSTDGQSNNQFGLRTALRAFLSEGEKGDWRDLEGNFGEGTFYIGGSALSLNFINDDFNNSTNFAFQPSIGYFFSDQVAAGIQISFNTTSVSDSDIRSTQTIFMPYGRYYFSPPQRMNNFATIGINFLNFSAKGDFFEASGSEFALFFGAGTDIFIAENLAIEGTFLFARNFDREVNNIGFDFAVQYFINR